MDTLTSIKVFQQVVESGSFVGAAKRLDMSTATVSKHVMHVEKRLGVRLLNRNNRTLSLTEPGRVYYERGKTILDELEATELELDALNAAPRGTLRITCPSWFAGQRLADQIARYRRLYPQIVVDVSFDDRVVDLVAEGYDVAFRVMPHELLPAGLIARPVRPVTILLAASREYLERKGAPKSIEDLARHEFVAVGNLDSLMLTGPTGKVEVPVSVLVRYRSTIGVANAVAAGIGIAPLPDIFFEDPMFEDVLVPILPEHPVHQPTLYLLYSSRKHVPLKTRTFIDFALSPASKVPAPKLPPMHLR